MSSLLMIPGPGDVPYSTMQNMGRPLVPHYGREWAEIYEEVRQTLKKVLLTSNEVFLTASSGHGGLEACLNAVAKPGDGVLVINNGFFGQRLAEIAASLELKAVCVDCQWGEVPDPEDIRAVLEREPQLKAVACAHSETSTGVANPIAEIGRLLRGYELPFIVDAVSSAGAMELRPDDWGIDFLVTAPQKGLESPPGLCIIAVSDKGWRVIKERGAKPHGFYFNLLVWKEYDRYRDYQPYFITMPTNIVWALKASLQAICEEGLEKRWLRHDRMARLFRQGLENIGLRLLSEKGPYSSTVTVFKMPPGLSSEAMVEFMDRSYSIKIASGLGPHKHDTARVGHMGLGASLTSIIPVLFAIEDFLRKNGIHLPHGQSLKDVES